MADSAGEKDFTSDRAKHLEMIQTVIGRMANASAWMKRLAIVVVGGAAALAMRGSPQASDLPALAVILMAIFWFMDARYHQQERWFREVFESVRKESHTQRPDFRVAPTSEIRRECRFWSCSFSWSTAPFYSALAAFLLLAWRVGK